MKSTTDNHWDNRALTIENIEEVNIGDIQQRDLENTIICKHLKQDMTILEVGCGSGYSSSIFRDHVRKLDAFDYSEKMIERAKTSFGEKDITFFVDNVLDIKNVDAGINYDLVICVRVLINLASLEQQLTAVRSMANLIKKGGKLILAEGYADGFDQLSILRKKIGLDEVQPAGINCYSYYKDLEEVRTENFNILESYNLGTYDFFTRIVYPLITDQSEIRHNTDFHTRIVPLVNELNLKEFDNLSRMRLDLLEKK